MSISDAAVDFAPTEKQLPKWVLATAENTKVSNLCDRCEQFFKRAFKKGRLRVALYYWLPEGFRLIAEISKPFPVFRFKNGYEIDETCGFCRLLNNSNVAFPYNRRGNGPAFFEKTLPGGKFMQLHSDYYNDEVTTIMFLSDKVLDRTSELTQEAGQDNELIRHRLCDNSQVDWQLMEAWLTDCRLTHHCKIVQNYVLPTRLVCMGLDGSNIRVQQTDNLPNDTKYCTLSHVWGTFPITKLKEGNFDQFEKSLPVQDLSKTFTDAIAVASRLGYNYIWIDSLCIIQDSIDDWRTESSLMSKVYSFSDLNIAAASANDGRDGCFSRDWQNRHVRVRPDMRSDEVYLVFDSDSWRKDIQESPLLQRAWVLQERYLAPRTLYFGKSQLYWECSKHVVAESHPVMELKPTIIDHCISQIGFQAYSIKYWGEVDKFEQWVRIVRLYSQCKLTKAEDRLVALSGVARHIQQQTDDEYVAGLWRNSLLRGLLWYTFASGLENPAIQISKYRAPSWSWAALDYQAPALMFAQDSFYFISVLGVKVKPLYGDPFGQIRHGSIHIQCGPLRRSIGRKGSLQSPHKLEITGKTRSTINWTVARLDFKIPEFKGQEFPLLVFGHHHKTGGGHRGLILKATGTKPGEYSRVGYFDQIWLLSAGLRRKNDESIWGEKSAVAEEGSYEKILEPNEKGLKQYVITLV